MKTKKVCNMNDINISNISYTFMDNNMAYIHYDNMDSFFIETPDLYCINGINEINSKYATHELYITLNSKEMVVSDNTKIFFETLDNKFIEDGKIYKNIWFAQLGDLNDKKIKYKSIVRYTDNDQESMCNDRFIKIKFLKTNNFSTLVFNKNREIINRNKYSRIFSKNCYVKLILECSAIWIKGAVYGVHIRPHQIRVSYGEMPLYRILDSSIDIIDKKTEKTDDILNIYDEVSQVTEYILSTDSE
jgi:hypothetical protein